MISFILNLINYFEKSNKHWRIEHMEYICDKIIFIEFENLNIYFKIKVVNGILGWIFFIVYDIDIHQLNLGQFRN